MTTPPQDIPGYVTWIIEQHPATSGLDPAVRAELQAEWEERLDNRINGALLDALTPVKQRAFEYILDHSPEDAQSFLATNIPNMDDIVAAILLAFRSEHLRS